MDLIDRYLVAVRRHLPGPLQKDIVEELSDSLRSEAEETEQQLGRALTAEDQSALLKKHGHPWLVASRYLPQQYLVGPALYPYYRQALVIVLFWVVLPISLGLGAIAAIYSQESARVWGKVLGAAWTGSIYSVGIVTIVFTVLESQRVRITTLDKWDPSWLPEPQEGRAVPRSETLIGLIFTTTFLLWWTDLLRAPQLIDYGGDHVRFVAEPIWAAVFLPVLISLLLTVATAFVDLIRPWRTTFLSCLRVVIDAGTAVIVVAVLRAGHWVQVVGDAQHAGNLARADYWINQGIKWTLVSIIVICLFEALTEIWRMVKARREVPA
jgi:hypothetical protein